MAINEKYLDDYPKPILLEKNEIISNQMRKNICKICLKDGSKGTGFFCQIPFPNKDNLLPVFITNNHLINENFLKNEKYIIVSINNDEITKRINLENKRNYTNKDYDITIIEIDKKKEQIYDFLDLDENKIENSFLDIIGNSIYILHYPKYLFGQKISVSHGILKQRFEDKKYDFMHYCSTEYGSSGSPILNLENNKVIGIHKKKSNGNYNIGAFLYYSINEFNEKYKKNHKKNDNEITINYKINNRNIINIFGTDFVTNNKNNCRIIINGQEHELKQNIKINDNLINKDILEIKLKGIKNITDMSYIFSNCQTLFSIPDITNWDTTNITNMSYMFFNCSNLQSLPDISNFITNNVNNFNSMFSGCNSLLTLPDISKWNTHKVTNMSNMFSYCSSLITLPDISKWKTNNVNNMKCMFYCCSSLKILPNLGNWNIDKVKDMSYMFYKCKTLKNLPDFNKWNVSNESNICGLFEECNKSINIPSNLRKKK